MSTLEGTRMHPRLNAHLSSRPWRALYGTFSQNFDFEKDHPKKKKSVDEKSLSILGYVPKNDENKNPGSRGLNNEGSIVQTYWKFETYMCL